MRKRINYRKLGRDNVHRWAMFRNMVTSIKVYERYLCIENNKHSTKNESLFNKKDLHHTKTCLRKPVYDEIDVILR